MWKHVLNHRRYWLKFFEVNVECFNLFSNNSLKKQTNNENVTIYYKRSTNTNTMIGEPR